MQNQPHIVLSGGAGTGKTTIGNLLAASMQRPMLSIGEVSRAYAECLGKSINEFQLYASLNPSVDEDLDQKLVHQAHSQGPCVLDYRLGPHFFPDAISIMLWAPPEVVSQRVLKSRLGTSEFPAGTTDEQATLTLALRNKQMQQRFIQTYHFDFLDQANYHLVLNTAKVAPEQAVSLIFAMVSSR